MKTEYVTVNCVVCNAKVKIPTCIETLPEYTICGSGICKERIKEYKKVREFATRKDLAKARAGKVNQLQYLQKDIQRFDYLIKIYDNTTKKTS